MRPVVTQEVFVGGEALQADYDQVFDELTSAANYSKIGVREFATPDELRMTSEQLADSDVDACFIDELEERAEQIDNPDELTAGGKTGGTNQPHKKWKSGLL